MPRSHQILERRWAEFNGLDPARMVACSSGTSALHLAMELSHSPEFGVVAIPDYCMVACARAVTLAGKHVVFADCGDDLLLRAGSLPYATDLSCVLAVHNYGRRCDMESLTKWVSANHCWLVEDLAELHGVPPHPLSDAACWSFYANKVVAGEEGGAVYFRDPSDAAKARRMRSLGFTDAHDFTHEPRGHNYRLADSLADIVLRDLDNYQENLRGRREVEALFEEAVPAAWKMPARAVPWVYDVRVPGLTRGRQQEVVRRLNDAGVAARMGFKPMSCQPEYDRWVARISNLGAMRAAEEVFYFPLKQGGVAIDKAWVASAVAAAVDELGRV